MLFRSALSTRPPERRHAHPAPAWRTPDTFARIGSAATVVKGTIIGKSGFRERISVRRMIVASARVDSSMAK